jgi:hypothetical protein
MTLKDGDIKTIFTYHPPTQEQIPRYEAIRNAAQEFALVLKVNTIPSDFQTDAILKLQDCVMKANASIALEGKIG